MKKETDFSFIYSNKTNEKKNPEAAKIALGLMIILLLSDYRVYFSVNSAYLTFGPLKST